MMDVDDDDDYFLYSLRLISQHVIRGSLKKAKLRLLGPSRMDVCSVALGLEWLRIIMSFVEFSIHVFTRGRS